jgi:hypothetical protein
MAPLQSYILGTNVTFSIDNRFCFKNTSDILQKLEVDFGNGSGYREVHFGDRIVINYSPSGFVQLKIKATYANQN